MQTIYNSDSYVVMQFLAPVTDDRAPSMLRGGYEIVDKANRREVFLEGALAERFHARGLRRLHRRVQRSGAAPAGHPLTARAARRPAGPGRRGGAAFAARA